MKQKQSLIKRGKYGLLFWFISCFIGSVIVVEIERYLFNEMEGFHMPISNGIILWFIMTVATMLGSSPAILTIYLLSKKANKLGRLISITFFITFAIAYFITLELSGNLVEALYITSPYFLLAFTFEIIYLKIERSITSTKSHGMNNDTREAHVS